MGVRHSGQPSSIAATASAQLSQNREWLHGTRATPVCEAIKRTSQQSVDCRDCAAVSVALVSLDGVVTSCCASCCCGFTKNASCYLNFIISTGTMDQWFSSFVSSHYPMDVLAKVIIIIIIIIITDLYSAFRSEDTEALGLVYLVRHVPVLHYSRLRRGRNSEFRFVPRPTEYTSQIWSTPAQIRHLEIVKSPYLNEKLSDFDEIWYTTPHLVHNNSHATKYDIFKNSKWWTAAMLKIVFWP